jgi:hypothetical protein
MAVRARRSLTTLPRGWRRFPLLTVLAAGWLGGGLLSSAVAVFVDRTNDQLYAAVNIVGALVALALLAAAGHRPALSRRRQAVVPAEAVPASTVRGPAQTGRRRRLASRHSPAHDRPARTHRYRPRRESPADPGGARP